MPFFGRIISAQQVGPLRISTFLFLLIVAGLLRACPVNAQAQEETLFGDEVDFGGFGGPVVKVTRIAETAAVLTGGRGGWIVNFRPNHTLVLGGGAYGLTTKVRRPDSAIPNGGDIPDSQRLEFGYGGVELEYVNRTRKLLHFSLQTLIGGGGISFSDDGDAGEENSFFVAEPQAHLMLNVTTFFRIGIGGGYRWISGAELDGIDDVDMRGPVGSLTLKFGGF